MNQFDIILKAFDLMLERKIWSDVPPSQLLKILIYLHNKGWLYLPMLDNEVHAVVAAYRIREITEENMSKIPEKEEGNILYVLMAISLKKEENMFKIARESLRIYLEQNPDIEQLVLEDKNEKLKIYNLQGDSDGKTESSELTTSTNAAI